MIGKPGKKLVPLALMVALWAQVAPMTILGGSLGALSFADSLVEGRTKSALPMKPLITPYSVSRVSKPEKGSTIYALQQLDENDAAMAKKAVAKVADNDGDVPALQGSVTSIRVTRGRSQIVKFAQPIMRISIAEPTVADIIPLSPDQIMINGKLRGVTSLIVWDENGQEGIFDLYIQNDTTELLDAVHSLSPNEKIQARVTDDSFILSGQVSNSVVLDEIRKTASAYGYRDDKFIDLTDTPVPQVALEVRIAEANRSIGRQLKSSFAQMGKNLSTNRLDGAIDTAAIGATRSTPGFIAGTSGLIPGNPLTAITEQAITNIGGITGTLFRNKNFNVAWDLMESKGKINTLANPTLVCTHGRTATFLAGGEFPFVGSVDQNGSPIVQFKEFGVKLNFTPWISPVSGRIELTVSPEVSNLDSANCITTKGAPVCGILKRSTNTTVDLMDGETLMISGIISREEQNNFNNVPFISSVPILGMMFKNSNISKQDRELVVVITPHIVKPSDYGKVLGSTQ
jgi:pilus assembly protein CpaC